MAIKFQYNKTFLQQLNKELKVRLNALPTLQAKEAALRNEVKSAKKELAEYSEQLEARMRGLSNLDEFWCEMPPVLSIADIETAVKSIAGVKTPYLGDIRFKTGEYSLFGNPRWLPDGLEILKSVIELRVRKKMAEKKLEMLEYARKKTTQKVNLYEKVQIPEYNQALLKIKRFLEDKENLAKSSQKILKARLEKEAAS
ncbi:MAG: V-type ATP synthase subunit D [Fibrobacterota bacterium]